jgi:hypothetical protein
MSIQLSAILSNIKDNTVNTELNSTQNLVKLLLNAIREDSKNIRYKDDLESNRLLIYLNFSEDTNTLTELERELRSVVLNRTTLELISYSMDELYTEDQKVYDLMKEKQYKLYECLEGTLLSVYYFNDKWYVSTRRCLDAKDSYWLSDKSHYDMFMECVSNELFDNLNKEHCYYFVLQHYQNKGVVDYSKRFGEEYKRAILLITRCRTNGFEEVVSDDFSKFGVLQQEELKDMSLLETEKDTENLSLGVQYEGILVKIFDTNIKYLRLPTQRYTRKSLVIPNAQNKYVSFIKLYQNGTLKDHFKYFPDNEKITHPTKPITYDTIGVVDSCVQTLVKELYNLFIMMYDLKFGEQKNKELYELLPKGYHDILYELKGIFYKKRLEQKSGKIKNHKLTERDIYYLLKSYNCNQFIFLLRGRKILRDAILKGRRLDKRYQMIYNMEMNCDIKQLLLSNIFLNYMFE